MSNLGQHRQRIGRRAGALHRERKEQRRHQLQQNFIGPYTPKQAHKVAVKETKTEFAPTERQIGDEIRGLNKREGEIDDWYTGLENQYAQGQQAAASAAQTADAATAATLGQSSQNTAALLQGLAGKDASFAALVGGPADTAGQTQQVEAAAAAERMRAALAAPLAAGRAIDVASYTPKRATAALAGIQAHKENAGTRAKERSDLRALRHERGAAVTKNLNALREQDQTFSTQQKALGVKSGYNKALEKQSAAGVEEANITAAATVAAAHAYAYAKERGATAQEASAAAYAAATKRGASAQEAVAAENRAASEYKANSNKDVAHIQGENAGNDKGGYTVAEGLSFLKSALAERGFNNPGEAVDYLVNRGVKRAVAKQAAGSFWRIEHAG